MDGRATAQLLAQSLRLQGPPVHIALDWCTMPGNREALVAFFVGDLFLARYARNYYARGLLPSSAHPAYHGHAAVIDRESCCLYCWHYHRTCILEDEAHVMVLFNVI